MEFSAQGAVDSLLRSLSSLLLEEAQLLGSVRREIQFINEEMKTMNGLLMHLAEVQDHNHHVRAWMKQVQELAYHSQNCVNHYVICLGPGPRDSGLLGRMRRIIRVLRTMPTRHRIAMQIRELKVHARDVGERRMRYGVTVPDAPAARKPPPAMAAPQDDGEEQLQDDDRTPSALLRYGADHSWWGEKYFEWGAYEVSDWVCSESFDRTDWFCSESFDRTSGKLMVIPIVGWEGPGEDPVARKAYERSFPLLRLHCKAWVRVGAAADGGRVLGDTLKQVLDESAGESNQSWGSKEQLAKRLQGHLEFKSFLLVFDDLQDESVWRDIKSALPQPASCYGTIILTTNTTEVVNGCSPHKILSYSECHFLAGTLNYIAHQLLTHSSNSGGPELRAVTERIISNCTPDVFAMKMFLHALYANPHRAIEELRNLAESRSQYIDAVSWMLMFCYNDLPSHYKTCLLYLTIFPKGYIIRRTSLLRRWVAERLISRRGELSELDEANRCFSMLVDRGFVRPKDMDAAGKVKACGLHDSIFDFIAWMARYENFTVVEKMLDKNRDLSIQNGKDGIETLLEFQSTSSSRLGRLNVLDLEGCRGLKKHHLENICKKIVLLKYLSLRNTDVTYLPKQIEKLIHLETLDIRQTEIQAFPGNFVLPMLKHLLAGHTNCLSKDAIRSKELFSTVDIPRGIRSMEQMQVLSHVQVSGSNRKLEDVGELRKLRKLGVVLHGKEANIKHLLHVIDRLNTCLRSVSIRIEPPAPTLEVSPNMNTTETIFSPPKFLHSLSISGIKSELPRWIEHLQQVTKITLHETNLKESDLQILGKIACLRCLKLRYKSYVEEKLTFRKEEFEYLKFLVVEGSDITSINYEAGATPKLEKIVWSFTTMQSLSGVNHLGSLKEVELNGNCHADLVKHAIEEHPNHPHFKHNQ